MPERLSLENIIEALLFYYAEPLTYAHISKLTNQPVGDVKKVCDTLVERFGNRGLSVIRTNTSIELVLHPELKEFIETNDREEAPDVLSEASLETLTAVLYLEPASKQAVDFIRGVDTTTSLRNLLSRGLIERERRAQSVLYRGTTKACAMLGISGPKDLPEHDAIRKKYSEYVAGALAE